MIATAADAPTHELYRAARSLCGRLRRGRLLRGLGSAVAVALLPVFAKAQPPLPIRASAKLTTVVDLPWLAPVGTDTAWVNVALPPDVPGQQRVIGVDARHAVTLFTDGLTRYARVGVVAGTGRTLTVLLSTRTRYLAGIGVEDLPLAPEDVSAWTARAVPPDHDARALARPLAGMEVRPGQVRLQKVFRVLLEERLGHDWSRVFDYGSGRVPVGQEALLERSGWRRLTRLCGAARAAGVPTRIAYGLDRVGGGGLTVLLEAHDPVLGWVQIDPFLPASRNFAPFDLDPRRMIVLGYLDERPAAEVGVPTLTWTAFRKHVRDGTPRWVHYDLDENRYDRLRAAADETPGAYAAFLEAIVPLREADPTYLWYGLEEAVVRTEAGDLPEARMLLAALLQSSREWPRDLRGGLYVAYAKLEAAAGDGVATRRWLRAAEEYGVRIDEVVLEDPDFAAALKAGRGAGQ